MKKILLKILRFFVLVIAIGAGVCCGIQAWIECDRKGIFDKKKIVIASADTYDDITDEDGRIYYCLGTDIFLSTLNATHEGQMIIFNGYSSDGGLVCSSSARITFENYINSSQYATFELRQNGILKRAYFLNPYYIFSFNHSIASLTYTVLDLSSNTSTTHTLPDTLFNLITKVTIDDYENGYNAGLQDGEASGYNAGYKDGEHFGYSDGYGIGLEEGYNNGYSVGNDEGFDAGWYHGYNSGYGEGLLECNRGLWDTVFNFSFGNSSQNDFTLYVTSENYDVFANGGISFSKLKDLYYADCELLNKEPVNIDSTPLTVTVRIMPLNSEISILSTGNLSLVGFDAYYTADGVRYWGSWSTIDEAEQSDVYSFDTYSEMSVIPDTFTFSFDSTWDFHLYLSDRKVGFTDYNVGYTQGSTDGYSKGYDDAYDTAYSKGYVDGKAFVYAQEDNTELSSSVRSFVFSVFDAPVSTFLDSFNFKVGDFDLGGLIAFIFTLIVIGGVVKVLL